MGCQSCGSRIVVWNVIRKGIHYAGFAPTLLLTCGAAFAQIYTIPVVRDTVVAPAPPPAPVNRAALRAVTPVTPVDNVPVVQAANPLDGLGVGAGIALSFGQSRVNLAVAVGPTNIVRVQDNSGVRQVSLLNLTISLFLPPIVSWAQGRR